MKSNDLLKTAKDLVYLVSCAVNGETPEKNICDKMNLDKVLKLARNQSLSAAAAIALENAGIISGEFREEKFKAVSHNVHHVALLIRISPDLMSVRRRICFSMYFVRNNFVQ